MATLLRRAGRGSAPKEGSTFWWRALCKAGRASHKCKASATSGIVGRTHWCCEANSFKRASRRLATLTWEPWRRLSTATRMRHHTPHAPPPAGCDPPLPSKSRRRYSEGSGSSAGLRSIPIASLLRRSLPQAKGTCAPSPTRGGRTRHEGARTARPKSMAGGAHRCGLRAAHKHPAIRAALPANLVPVLANVKRQRRHKTDGLASSTQLPGGKTAAGAPELGARAAMAAIARHRHATQWPCTAWPHRDEPPPPFRPGWWCRCCRQPGPPFLCAPTKASVCVQPHTLARALTLVH